ncbi:hypothetical protein M413DRAFT_442073 [Hebeloma cylindrosporum]|uniref:Uncharacterized protein n=1 Tax=Hebeloma cylindrosporum TaxID=76867 RepID=A0A0C3CNK0_HEBCY|nr:hypothetical protein M413DRAFT_442073 [Hebeloma cylindrosporum h7]
MEGILKLCPSLERFVLYPRPVPPITDQHIRWFEVGNDIWDSQFPHTSPGHSIVIGAFPSLKTLREPSQRWSGWNACFRDLKSSFPHVVRGIGGVQECMGLDIHDDVGEIFVHISDMWTDDSADGGYESSSTMEEDDSDSESESDWDIGSEKDFKDPEAPMDLLNSC